MIEPHPAAETARVRLGLRYDCRETDIFVLGLNGAPDTNRTYDLPLRRGPLYPLSYRGAPRDFNA